MSAAENTEIPISVTETPVEAITPAIMTIDTEMLRTALAKFAKIITSKFSMPILRGIMITAEGFHVTLLGTNLETTLSLCLPASVTGTCAVVADYKALVAAVKGIRTTDTVIILSEQKILVEDTVGGLRSTVCSLGETSDYPEMPQRETMTDENKGAFRDLTVPGAALAEGLRFVIPGMKEGDTRYALNGVHWGDGQKGGIELATSNTHVLYTHAVPLTCGDQLGEADFILSPGVAEWLAKHAGDTARVTVQTSPNLVFFGGSGWNLISRKIEGKFPCYRDVMPSPDRLPGRLIVKRQTLLAALKTASAHCAIDARHIDFLPGTDEDTLEVRITRNGSPQFTMTIPAASRKCRPIQTKIDDLLKFLATYPGDTVTIRYEDVGEHEGPAAVYDGNKAFVFMPLNSEGLSEEEQAERVRMLEAYQARLSEPDQAFPATLATSSIPVAKRAPSYRAVVARAKNDPGYLSALLSALGIRAAAFLFSKCPV